MVSSNDSENNFKSSAWSFSRLGKFGRRQFYVYSFRERLKIDDELIDRYSTSVVLIKSNSRYKFTRGNLYWLFKYNNYSVTIIDLGCQRNKEKKGKEINRYKKWGKKKEKYKRHNSLRLERFSESVHRAHCGRNVVSMFKGATIKAEIY